MGPPAREPAYDSGPRGTGLPPARPTPGSITRTNVPKPITCTARLELARTNLPPNGGEFTVPAVVTPAGCAPAVALASPWVRTVDAATFRFQADANTSNLVRDTLISVGETSFFVRQEPPAQPGLAAAPSRLTFGLDKKGKTDSKRITAWTENGAGKFAARPGHPWLTLKPRRNKDQRQTYEVSVQRNAGLGPGRYDTFVELRPSGSTNAIRIPVVVEVPGAN